MAANLKKNKIFRGVTGAVAAAVMFAAGFTAQNVVDTRRDNNKTDGNLSYTALGDSITYGYKLRADEKNYPSLLAENIDAKLVNYAVVGMNSEQLLEKLQSGEFDVSNADLITLDIGSNDLLLPFQAIITEKLGLSETNDILAELFKRYHKHPLEVLPIINEIREEMEASPIFENASRRFADVTFPAILGEIRRQNPEARLVVANLYNPYYSVNFLGFFNVGAFAEKYIGMMNEAFLNPNGYETVDIYSHFQAKGLTNVNLDINEISKLSVDPHPTEQGHRVIFSIFNESFINS